MNGRGTLQKLQLQVGNSIQQEIIPVGTLPPTLHYMGGGGSVSGGLPDRDPNGQRLSWTETPRRNMGLMTETTPPKEHGTRQPDRK